jgi:hypothetical protein
MVKSKPFSFLLLFSFISLAETMVYRFDLLEDYCRGTDMALHQYFHQVTMDLEFKLAQ